MLRPLGIALAGLAFLGAAPAVLAQDDEQAELQAKYEQKVAESWFTDNGFTDDFDLARERARDSRTPIFVYFTRSYSP
ncbi:MAG: hypothetical protein ACYTG2_08960 [Planctomycetota bacterium]|jgi:hypothetical protein